MLPLRSDHVPLQRLLDQRPNGVILRHTKSAAADRAHLYRQTRITWVYTRVAMLGVFVTGLMLKSSCSPLCARNRRTFALQSYALLRWNVEKYVHILPFLIHHGPLLACVQNIERDWPLRFADAISVLAGEEDRHASSAAFCTSAETFRKAQSMSLCSLSLRGCVLMPK